MTKKEIKEPGLIKASEKIMKDYGLDFTGEKLKDLYDAIKNSANGSGYKDPNQFSDKLISGMLNIDELDLLLKNLTVGETYFFRDEKLFKTLQSSQFQEMFKSKNSISVLSAGCASGEEPYSIAILIDKFYSRNSNTQFKIYAGDLNKHSLEKADKGIYRDWSFRSTPEWVKKEYFTESDKGLFKIKNEIKTKVEFFHLNLSELEKLKNDFKLYDIIICRNVLIYFSKPVVKNLINTFYEKLNGGGIYITTASESVTVDQNLFSKFIPGTNTIFKKQSKVIHPKIKLKPPKRESVQRRIFKTEKSEPRKGIIIKRDIKAEYSAAVKKYKQGNFSESILDFKNLYAEMKNSEERLTDKAEYYFYFISNYLKLGRLKDANKLCDEVLEDEKLDYRLHYLHGVLLQETGSFEEAEKAFNKSIYLNNKFPLSFFALADLQLSSGNKLYEKNFKKTKKLLAELDIDTVINYSDGETPDSLIRKIDLHS